MSNAALPHLFQEELYQIPETVIVILAREWDTYAAEDKSLLSKILASVKINLAAVRLVTQHTLSLSSLVSYHPSKVLVFGSTLEGLKPYDTFQAQGFSVLRADDLPQLDEAKKKSLWVALKKMFGL